LFGKPFLGGAQPIQHLPVNGLGFGLFGDSLVHQIERTASTITVSGADLERTAERLLTEWKSARA
jgi:hypothetical protein